jgi:2-haloacid dehalogenase
MTLKMATPLQGIKACVFDGYGTLFDVHTPVLRALAALDDKAQPFSFHWRDKQLQYTWLRSLMGVHADFWQVTSDALDHTMQLFGLADRELHGQLMELYLHLDAFEDAGSCLAELQRRGFRLAILSNGSPAMLEAAVRAAGFARLFEQVISVEEVGIYKPSRRVYRHAQQVLKLASPQEVCFISANSWDAKAAASFGFQVVWINRSGGPADRIPGTPALELESLEALPRHLGR